MFHKDSHFDYFDAFDEDIAYACQEADLLQEVFADYRPEWLHGQLEKAHAIEHSADLVNHDVYTHLASEFIAPIEREDIDFLTQALDDIVDNIEGVMQRLYMYNITAVPQPAKDMADVISKSCLALREAFVDFHTFKHSSNTQEHLIQVNTYEEEGDRIYLEAMRELYSDCEDLKLVMAWASTLAKLEKCCDACERVANAMSTIIMKNS
jgi:uncharacterized protein Yka (UPF0111/DUF47 family)